MQIYLVNVKMWFFYFASYGHKIYQIRTSLANLSSSSPGQYFCNIWHTLWCSVASLCSAEYKCETNPLQALAGTRIVTFFNSSHYWGGQLNAEAKKENQEDEAELLTAAKGCQRRGRADHGTGGHENDVCV
jgi:hypothetical protein